MMTVRNYCVVINIILTSTGSGSNRRLAIEKLVMFNTALLFKQLDYNVPPSIHI